MKKILILTSRYLPKPSANGINTKYIVDELIKRGYEVSIISTKDKGQKKFEIINNTKIYRITSSLYSKILLIESKNKNNKLIKSIFKIVHFIRKIKLTLLLYNFPNFDLYQNYKTYKLLNRLHKIENFNCVIGVFKPYHNIAALLKFKKYNKGVICGGYYLDLINSCQKPSIMPQKLYNKLIYKADEKSFNILNFIMIPIAAKKVYENKKYSKFYKKIDYIDFPTFMSLENNNAKNNNIKNNKYINIIYAGTLDTIYRNPKMFLESLKKVSMNVGGICLHIYGKSNCNDIIEQYNNDYLKIYNNGFESHELIIDKMLRADFIVNVSNRLENAIPSKIFEIFSIGKPIINYVFDINDKSNVYFEKYPAVFNFAEWKDFNKQIIELQHFILNKRGKSYDRNKIRKNYLENTPEYTVNIIEKRSLSKTYK